MSRKLGWQWFSILILIWAIPLAANESESTPTSPVATAISEAQPAVELPAGYVGDALLGQEKSQVCTACHGVEGNSVVPAWPKIAGQLEKYLVKELKEYRKGEKGARFDPTMYSQTLSLTDSDIADLAAYFSKQTETLGSVKPELLALGEKIYKGGNLATGVPPCAACHSPDGMGNGPATFPRLSGQFPEYTVEQLKKFRANTRSDDPNGIMRDIAKKMTDEEIQAVSSYVSGLH